MPKNAEQQKILNECLRPRFGDFSIARVAPQSMGSFDIQEVGCVQGFGTGKNLRFNARTPLSPEEPLDDSGSVEDDHLESRASRMTCAAGVDRVMDSYRRKRSCISSSVGRSAISRISLSR